ncbi:MAG: VWA domain-containing protein [Verrucomicrobia bacterium]|nr:VWA domain-containing protein [Verrucomicrobiota bacterium]
MNFALPQLAEPRWLWLAVLGPLSLVALHRYSAWARRRQLAQLAAPKFLGDLTRSHSPARRAFKHAVLVLAMAGIGLALARPQWGEQENAGQSLGEDIMFVVDCSQSMLAADVTPNRLQRAKLAILDFVQRRGRGRVGLVAFAGQAFLQCPLTFDYGAFEDALTALDEKTIPVPGTDIGRALNEAFQGMEKLDRRKVMVLITDGEDLEKGGIRAAQDLATNGVVVFTLGVGTPAGAQIQVLNEQGKPAFLRDSKGAIVRSRLDEATLRAVAQATRGSYHPLGPVGEGLIEVSSAIETMDVRGDSARARRFAIERFHVPVAAVLLLVVMESLIGTRRRALTKVVSAGLALAFAAFGPNSFAESSADRSVAQGLADAKQTIPVTPLAPWNTWLQADAAARVVYSTGREFFNAGTRKLKDEQWRDAEPLFESALASQKENLQPPTLYNLGLARFALGVDELKKSPAGKATAAKAQATALAADGAVQAATEALASQDLQKMLAAYRRGRGVRRELKAATAAVRRAMEVHGNVLAKWQRASGDFKSAVELKNDYADARHNADVVDRHIAKLVDSLRELQSAKMCLAQKSGALGEALKALKGKLPAPDGSPGPGEDEDDEPFGPKPGTQEPPGREGQEMKISPEQAGQLLDGFKLGGDARLPIAQGIEGRPKDRTGRTW